MDFNIKTTGSAKDFYYNGYQFLQAAWRCFGEKNTKEGYDLFKDGRLCQLPVPTVINAAFACEMFLKSLLIHHEVQYRPDHDLLRLFRLLPDNDQSWIAKFCGPGKNGNNVIQLFENSISKHALDFKKVRYYVENNSWNECSPIYMVSLAENMSQITQKLLKDELL